MNEAEAALALLPDELIIDLFRYACASHDEQAADVLEAEITRRGIYGRTKPNGG